MVWNANNVLNVLRLTQETIQVKRIPNVRYASMNTVGTVSKNGQETRSIANWEHVSKNNKSLIY